MRIIETCNFGGDDPIEHFINLPDLTNYGATQIADAINQQCSGNTAPRYWRVVDNDYQLSEGFQP